jgi:predicted metal-dependent hydrolase
LELYQIEDREIIGKIKMLYEKWLNEQAQTIFKEKINEFSKITEDSPKDWQIKKLKNRWSSLTKNKKIVLNVNLVKAPQT